MFQLRLNNIIDGLQKWGAAHYKRIIVVWSSIFISLLLLFIFWPRKPILSNIDFSDVILSRDGQLLRIYLTSDDKYRAFRPLPDYPKELIDAVIIQEDSYFYKHFGINPVALVNAAWETYINQNYIRGASTITMQVAKLRYKLYTKNLYGKIKQILYALYLECFYSKQEILEAYLNLVPCGSNIEGYSAASYKYFNTDVKDISFSETLYLAIIPQDPNNRQPQNRIVPDESYRAREVLFDSWLKNFPEYSNKSLEIAMPLAINGIYPFIAPHFCDSINYQKYSEYNISSTLDLDLQETCSKELYSYLELQNIYGVRNGAIMLIDYTSMDVLAMVGSANYFDNTIDGFVNGADSKRSPGSTLKPFIYGLAIDQGLIHTDSLLKDAPTAFNEYAPDNYQSDFQGAVPAWKALTESRNVPAVYLADQLESPDLYDFLDSAGVSGLQEKDHYGLSIVLGSAELTMTELVQLYAALPNKGILKELNYIKNSISQFQEKQILSEESSFLVLNMLEKNYEPFSRPELAVEIPIAFKTGTSIGFKDAWSIAVFDKYVLAVWFGNFDGAGDPVIQGRNLATPLLFSIADSILTNMKSEDFYHPELRPITISDVDVCSVSGALPNDYCPYLKQAGFIPGVSPIDSCDIHRQIYVDVRTGYRSDDADSPFTEAKIREFWSSDLIELYKSAGLPRIIPPLYPPDDKVIHLSSDGFAPVITSPISNVQYHLEIDRSVIPLSASVDSDTSELYWFANSSFIGKSKPGEIIEWEPGKGQFDLIVTDDKGRSDSLILLVD